MYGNTQGRFVVSSGIRELVRSFEGFVLEPEDNPSNKRIVKPQDLTLMTLDPNDPFVELVSEVKR